MKNNKFLKIKTGDVVQRTTIDGRILKKLTITEIDNFCIYCGKFKFRIDNGAEINDDLGWNGVTHTGSYIDL